MSDEENEADDPYLRGVIDEAIGPLAALLPPEELAALRRALRDTASDDPELAKLHDAARPRVARQTSGEELAHPEKAAPEEAAGTSPLRRKKGSAA